MRSATMTLETLHLLSNDLCDDFKQQLDAAIADCRQRPAPSKKRRVELRLDITPHPQDPDDVIIQPVTIRKTPARLIQPIRARRGRGDQLQFDFADDDGELK